MRAFFREIPPEIEEAALVDGCGRCEAFCAVTLPLAVPGLIAAGILAFIFSWNEFPIALSLTSRRPRPCPSAIARFAQQYEIQHAQMAAASVISTIPARAADVARPALHRPRPDARRGEVGSPWPK